MKIDITNIDFGVGFDNKIWMGIKSKDGKSFKDIPHDITNRFECVMFDHLSNLKEHGKMLCFTVNDKQYEVSLKEVEDEN